MAELSLSDEGSSGTAVGSKSSGSGSLNFLTGSWVNERVMNVADKVDKILAQIIDMGLLGDGFAPFQMPVTEDMILKMTPQQLEAFLTTLPSEQEKAQVVAIIAKLKLPMSIALPPEAPAASPAPAPKLSFGPLDQVQS